MEDVRVIQLELGGSSSLRAQGLDGALPDLHHAVELGPDVGPGVLTWHHARVHSLVGGARALLGGRVEGGEGAPQPRPRVLRHHGVAPHGRG